MALTKKFWKGVVFGAIAGGIITLLDRETRRSVANNLQKRSKEVSYYITHPNELADQVKDSTNKLRVTVEEVSEDLSFIKEKIEELIETTPTVKNMIKETKDAFSCENKES